MIRGDFNVQVYGPSVSQSVFHLLHMSIVVILKDYKKKIWKEMNEEQFCLYLTFLIEWSKLLLSVINKTFIYSYSLCSPKVQRLFTLHFYCCISME